MNPRYYYSGTDGGGVNIVFGGVLGSGGGDSKALAVESGILVASDDNVYATCTPKGGENKHGIILCYILRKRSNSN